MKKRTSITISTTLLAEIDRLIGAGGSRSAFIEKILSDHFRKLAREEVDARDMILINAAADRLNTEMEDALRYRADIFEIHKDQTTTE